MTEATAERIATALERIADSLDKPEIRMTKQEVVKEVLASIYATMVDRNP